MKRFTSLLLLAGMLAASAAGDDVVFRKSRLLDDRGKERKVHLVFRDAARTLVVQDKKSVFAEIPFDSLVHVAYGYTQNRHVADGLQMIAGAPILAPIGGIVMLIKERKHWLYVDYLDPAGASAELVLRLHKSEYESILATVQSQTGQEVEILPQDRKKGESAIPESLRNTEENDPVSAP